MHSVRKFLPVLALFACLLWTPQARGQLSWVQSTFNLTNASSLGLAYGTNTTNHSLLVAQFLVFGGSGAALSTIADSHSNTWVQAGATCGTSGSTTGLWYVYYVQSNSSAGADTVTVTGNGATTVVDMGISEYTNQAASALDVAGTCIDSAPSSSTVSFPSITTTLNSESILALARITANPNTVTQGAGYTNRWTNTIGATALELPADGAFNLGSHTTTFTLSSASTNNFSNLIAFKATNSALPSAAQPAPYIIKYHPPEKFTPLLLYTILRNWIKEAYEGRA